MKDCPAKLKDTKWHNTPVVLSDLTLSGQHDKQSFEIPKAVVAHHSHKPGQLVTSLFLVLLFLNWDRVKYDS